MLQKESADGFARSSNQPKNIIKSHLTPRRLKSMNSPSFAQRSSPSSGTTSLRATHSKRIVEPDKSLLRFVSSDTLADMSAKMEAPYWSLINLNKFEFIDPVIFILEVYRGLDHEIYVWLRFERFISHHRPKWRMFFPLFVLRPSHFPIYHWVNKVKLIFRLPFLPKI